MQTCAFPTHSFNKGQSDHSLFLKRFEAEPVDVIFINAQCCTGRKWVLAD